MDEKGLRAKSQLASSPRHACFKIYHLGCGSFGHMAVDFQWSPWKRPELAKSMFVTTSSGPSDRPLAKLSSWRVVVGLDLDQGWEEFKLL